MPGFIDSTTETGVAYSDLKHFNAYMNYGDNSGTNVLVPDESQYYEFGAGWSNQTFGFFGATRKIGEYYNPIDGFISHPGIAGYALYMAKIWDFDSNDSLASVGASGFVDRYQGPLYGIAQSDNQLLVDILTKHALDLQLFTGSNYWRFNDLLTPISQNGGFQFTYDSGLQTNNPGQFPYHGPSSYPTQISYNGGRYGAGRLDTWFRTTTIRVGNRGALTLAVDSTAQSIPSPAPDNIQWFESLSYAYQISANSSFAIGVRRVIGNPPLPNGGGDCVGRLLERLDRLPPATARSEIYVAYGNPNTLMTVPQAIFKVIFYAGAARRARKGSGLPALKPCVYAGRYEGHAFCRLCDPHARALSARGRGGAGRTGRPLQADVLEQRGISPDGTHVLVEASRMNGPKNSYDRTIELVDVSSGSLTHNVTKHVGDGDLRVDAGRPQLRLRSDGREAEAAALPLHACDRRGRRSSRTSSKAFRRRSSRTPATASRSAVTETDPAHERYVDFAKAGFTPKDSQKKSDINVIDQLFFETNGQGYTYRDHQHIWTVDADGSHAEAAHVGPVLRRTSTRGRPTIARSSSIRCATNRSTAARATSTRFPSTSAARCKSHLTAAGETVASSSAATDSRVYFLSADVKDAAQLPALVSAKLGRLGPSRGRAERDTVCLGRFAARRHERGRRFLRMAAARRKSKRCSTWTARAIRICGRLDFTNGSFDGRHAA